MSFALSSLSPATNFSAYVAWAQSQPNLSVEEEQKLLRDFNECNDLQAVKKILLSHLKYVISIAVGYSGYGLSIQDLVQEGNIGLMKAVRRFDIRHAVRFSTFAVYWVKSEIREYIIRNWRMVKIATTKAQRKLFYRLRKSLDYEARTQDNLRKIALDSGVSLEDTQHMHARMLYAEESLEGPVPHQDHNMVLGDVLSLSCDNPMDVIGKRQSCSMRTISIKNAIDSLNAREKWIIEQRWMLEDESNKATLESMSQSLGISVERVRQLEVQALKRMKKYMDQHNVSSVDVLSDMLD